MHSVHGMKYFVLFAILLSIVVFVLLIPHIVFADQIPEYVNTIVPPYNIIPTDEFGNIISPKFLNQTIYFHFNMTNENPYPLDLDIEKLVISRDPEQIIINNTEKLPRLESGNWATVVWKFVPDKVGNYLANIYVKQLPITKIGYPFVITDPKKKYETVTINILSGSTKNKCVSDECFLPSHISIQPDTIVTWTNNDSSLHIVSTGQLHEDPLQNTFGASYDNRFQLRLLKCYLILRESSRKLKENKN